ncbi:MAG: glycine dehydrogenase (aminomethyl-transferring) [Betaproteobacteria bacterium]|nr:MAG: glycine dehydrogenase (aminomethyl-transferring) [Betaproteobacteria bacterium]
MPGELANSGEFIARHIGIDAAAERQMLEALGVDSLEALVRDAVPVSILHQAPLALGEPASEAHALARLKAIAARNERWRSFIGMGYYDCFTPRVVQRNVIENPGWYTAYTPYQAEISQGRLEALLVFQQMVIDLTGLPIANASLLDEASAAAEAMLMIRRSAKSRSQRFFVDAACHPQVIAVLRTRARWLGIELVVGDPGRDLDPAAVFGAHFQYPDTQGRVRDLTAVIAALHASQALASMGCDLLALLLLRPPGALGADVAIGSAQRFGVPMGYGGPHAAFMACRDEWKRAMPGRIIGVSVDAAGRPALRMALQAREQHIRREKATSNICTAQALLAVVAAFYAAYHGPEGLKRIALRANFMARLLAACVAARLKPVHAAFFDTVSFAVSEASAIRARANAKRINLRWSGNRTLGVSFDETSTAADVADVAEVLTGDRAELEPLLRALAGEPLSIPQPLRRADGVLTHPVFNRYHTETEMMRYLKRLENRDFSLVHGMIPLGSCTMKLNAAAELEPISWPEFAAIHPFAPPEQAPGYRRMLAELRGMLAEITGLPAVSLQPNSGAQGEYAGLLAIRGYLEAKGGGARDVCLIPASAHGTNPASAHMAGLRVVVVACDEAGNVDVADLQRRIDEHRDRLAALMVTYPTTHGVFEEAIVDICERVHAGGAQVYMDGANLNAMVGLAKPGDIGADVCHINLHKTFCIPHGGGGPGMGPIAAAAHLEPFLPGHPSSGDETRVTVSAAPFGSALILPISWMYIRMMGARGLRRASEIAILNANYVAERLKRYFPVLYAGRAGRVAHECILDLRKLKPALGVSAEDVAKRLMDYGFHAPTLSFPVADTLMVEPTESESKHELDRFCDAMIAIHGELEKIRQGLWDRADNPLRNAPHTAVELAADWRHSYSREEAAFPVPGLRAAKFWPAVKRIDAAFGDRNLVCTCPPVEACA